LSSNTGSASTANNVAPSGTLKGNLRILNSYRLVARNRFKFT
jgi:hypothetical protein